MLKPKYFFIGVFLGLVLMSFLGRWASREMVFSEFRRFYTAIEPSGSFFPTYSELLNTAKAQASPEKTLILIGGSSIMRGVGQRPDHLWSRHLQDDLGANYVVLNFAVDRGRSISFSGAAYLGLRDIYKKIIFITLGDPVGWPSMDGGKSYSYLFWDGYYKGLFKLTAGEQTEMNSLRWVQLKNSDEFSVHAGAFLDGVLYFRDFWNYIGYNYFFPVWDVAGTRDPLLARKLVPDEEDAALVQEQRKRLENQLLIAMDLQMMNSLNQADREASSESGENQREVMDLYAKIYRNNSIFVYPRINPSHLSRMDSARRNRYNKSFSDRVDLMKSNGFDTLVVGEDWSPSDFYDGFHISETGSPKLAAEIAHAVHHWEQKN